MRWLWLLVVCWFGVAGVAQNGYAQADDGTGVIIVDAPKGKSQEMVTRVAASALSAAGWKIKPATFSDREIKTAVNCLPSKLTEGCLKSLLRAKRASRVAIIVLKLDAATDELAISGRLMVPGVRMAPFEQRFCDRCTEDVTQGHVEALLSKLLGQLAVYSGRTVIEVMSVPAGATFYLDNQPAGVTPAKVPVAPGPHMVRIEAAGHAAVERQVTGVEDTTARVEVILASGGVSTAAVVTPAVATAVTPAGAVGLPTAGGGHASGGSAPVQAQKRAGAPSRVGPGLLMLTGGLAVIGGSVALTMNERAPDAPMGQEQPRTYTSTLLPGGVAVGGGLVAVGVGYWWWKSISKQTRPVIAAGAAGASVGIAGTF